MSMTSTQINAAWRRYFAGERPEAIAFDMEIDITEIMAVTVEREQIIVAHFIECENVTETARAKHVAKSTVVALAKKAGFERKVVVKKASPTQFKAAPVSAAARPPRFFLRPVEVDDAPPTAVDFEGLEGRHCRYPYGESAPFKFCGAASSEVYCDEHRKLCSTPPRADVFVSDKQAA